MIVGGFLRRHYPLTCNDKRGRDLPGSPEHQTKRLDKLYLLEVGDFRPWASNDYGLEIKRYFNMDEIRR
jgi:hypothetical protein